MNLPSESIVRANGADLCVGTFGDAGDPAILLIMGSSASMDWWEDDFWSASRQGPASSYATTTATRDDR